MIAPSYESTCRRSSSSYAHSPRRLSRDACLGTDPETLHGLVDEIVEGNNALDVVTTWHDDLDKGCWYFVRTVATPLQVAFTDREDVAPAIRRAFAD